MLKMKWVLLLALLSTCTKKEAETSMSNTGGNITIDTLLTLSHRVGDIVNHTAFQGFGTGKGTDAEGWMNKAIMFWKKYISNE